MFICPVCKHTCGQAHTLKERYEYSHNEKITTIFAKTHGIEVDRKPPIERNKPPIKRAKVECHFCGIICSGKSNLTRHILKQHNDTKVKCKDENQHDEGEIGVKTPISRDYSTGLIHLYFILHFV